VQSQEAWTLWASARVAEVEGDELKEALQAIPLTRDGTVPLVRSCPSFREARLGPVGSALAHAGVIVATDGAVKEDGRMGAAYVALDGRITARSFVVLGPPSSMRAELSGMDEVATDAPMDEDLTILTDSLSSIQKLCCMQRQDFPEWLHGHPERPLLQSLVTRINTRERAQVVTRIIKVPAHRAHVLNEAADAAASRAAEAADTEIVLVALDDANFDGDADSDIVREALNDKVTVVVVVDVTVQVSDDEGEVLARRREETDNETLAVAVTLVVCDIVLVQLGDSELDAVTVTVSVLEEELLVESVALELAVIDCDEELSALGSIEADADGVVDGVSDTVGDDVGVLVAVAVFDVDGDRDAVNDTVLDAVDVAV
jgi:ribonuclease HI